MALSIGEFKKRLQLVHGDNVKLIDHTFVRVSKKATFVDVDHGEWTTLCKVVLRGCRHTKYVKPQESKLTIDVINDRLTSVHEGHVRLADSQVYVNNHAKLTFIDDEYGTWEAATYSVLAGHGHPLRGHHSRNSKSRLGRIIKHWKTGIDLVCTASYEFAFVTWCNENKIDFDWQIPFKMPNGRTYIIDAFIKSGVHFGTWIEIKGTFARKNGDVSKQKWEWFHAKFPNTSQLWTLDVLKKNGVL